MTWNYNLSIQEIKRYLPLQNPLYSFLHNNIFQAFEDRPFFDGIYEAGQLYRGRTLPSGSYYREQLENGEIERAVLDYKTKGKSALRARLKNFEDHQLAFYGLLNAQIADANANLHEENVTLLDPVDTAFYVALELERDKTGDVEAQDYSVWKSELKTAIRKNMQAIQHGAGLPAQGVESVCTYCDVRGLCRKGAW